MDVSKLDKHRSTSDGRTLPLVFVYAGEAYYFDMDSIFDDKSTLKLNIASGRVTSGLRANKALVKSISTYGKKRGDVWIDPDFRDSVRGIVAGK